MRLRLLLLALAPALHAQQPDWRVQAVIDVEHRTGWGYGQLGLPPLSPNRHRDLFGIDSVRATSGGGRTWHLGLVGFRSTMPGTVTVDAAGRLIAHHAAYVARTPDRFETPETIRTGDVTSGYGLQGDIVPPDARFWDLVPTFRSTQAAPGASWVDTLDQSATLGPYRVTRHVVRRSRIVRDTVVDGRQAWIIADTAAVTVHESLPLRDGGIGVTDTLVRDAQGTSAGWSVYEPTAPLVLQRDDSTHLTGTATLRDRTGRAWTSPARFVQARTLRGMGLGAWRTLDRQRQQARMRARGGMVQVPQTPVARRIAAGDTVLRDSIFRAVQVDPKSPENRVRMLDLLWAAQASEAFAERLKALLATSRDTIDILDRIISPGAPGLTEADARLLIAAGDDPAILLRHGRLPGEVLGAAAHLLARRPPAAMPFLPTRDSFPVARWAPACQPAACARLAAARGNAHHPDVRELALLAAFATDPATHADAVRHADRSRVTLQLAADLLDGVGATWFASAKPALPPMGSDWRAWQRWMQGGDSTITTSGPMQPPQFALPRFEEAHMVAIAFHRALTGRDVPAELSRAFAATTDDSARAALGTILLRLGALNPTPQQLAADLRGGSRALRALASDAISTRLLPGLLGGRDVRPRTIPPEDSALHAMLVDTLLTRLMGERRPWRHIEERAAPTAPEPPRPLAAARSGAPAWRLLSETTDSATLARWRDRMPAITRAELEAMDATQSAMVLELDPWRRVGPFVLVGLETSQLLPAPPGPVRRGYASVVHFVLLEVDGEWFIVGVASWVT